MVILCPSCGTGFNLPDQHVTQKGAKLRCSKCEHIFRVRRGADGESEIFYKPEDRELNEQAPEKEFGSLLDDGDADQTTSTQFGFGSLASTSAADDAADEFGGGYIGIPSADSEPQEDMDIGAELDLDLGAGPRGDSRSTSFGMPAGKRTQAMGSNAGGGSRSTSFGMPAAEREKQGLKLPEPGSSFRPRQSKSTLQRQRPAPILSPSIFGDEDPAEDPMVQEGMPGFGDAPEAKGVPGFDNAPDAKGMPGFDKLDLPDVPPVPEPAPRALPDVDDARDKSGIDLFDDESQAPFLQDPEHDPFGGAFMDEEPGFDFGSVAQKAEFGASSEDEDLILQPSAPRAVAQRFDSGGDEHGDSGDSDFLLGNDAAGSFGGDAGISHNELSFGAEDLDAPKTDNPFLGGESTFGSADDLVDPNFGIDGPAFDPSAGVIGNDPPAPAKPKAAAPAPGEPKLDLDLGRGGATPAPRRQQQSAGPARPAAAAAAPAPHNIGSSGLRRVADFAFITLIVLNCFLGVITVLSGGFIDFKSFGTMLEVAFMDGTYEPRPEWAAQLTASADEPADDTGEVAEDTDTTAATSPSAGLKMSALSIERVALKKRGYVWMMRGLVENGTDAAAEGVVIKGAILGLDGDVLVERDAPLGQLTGNKAILKLKQPADAAALVAKEPKTLEPGEVLPFTVIFEKVPKKVRGGRPTLHRATIVLPEEVAEPPAEEPAEEAP